MNFCDRDHVAARRHHEIAPRYGPMLGAPRLLHLSCATLPGTPLNPNTAANRSPRTRDGGYALARQQKRLNLLAQRAAAIQFRLPVNRSCVRDRRKRQQHRHRDCFRHILARCHQASTAILSVGSTIALTAEFSTTTSVSKSYRLRICEQLAGSGERWFLPRIRR